MRINPPQTSLPPDRPTPTIWTDRARGHTESTLDSETAVTLNCHLYQDFATSTDWSGLLNALAKHGFSLEFQNGRLVLVNDQTGVPLSTCAFLGHSFAKLRARLGKPCVLAHSCRLIPRPV